MATLVKTKGLGSANMTPRQLMYVKLLLNLTLYLECCVKAYSNL